VLCGVTHRAEDAIEPSVASTILSIVPPYVGRYVVTHLTDQGDIIDLVNALPVDTLQLHADLSPDVVINLKRRKPELRFIKSIHIESGALDWRSWERYVDAILIDSIDRISDRIGGTGMTHDWSISAEVVQQCPIPVILAGGLSPANVAQAIATVKPWAVNVNSGVENNGAKDPSLVAAFVAGTC
jgi:phosphoribosylanthranilate isomerase